MAKIKARFYLASITKMATGLKRPGYADPAPIAEVTLRAVNRKTDDNIEWASATPAGVLTMSVRGEAVPAFEALLGEDVYLSIERAEPVE